MIERTGWLLDLYADLEDGLALWFLDEQGRHRLRQAFPVTFFAAGPAEQLRALWRYLRDRPERMQLQRQERRDLFLPQPLPVLAVQVEQPVAQPRLFQEVSRAFPELAYYDADLPLNLRHAAQHGSFPLAYCRVKVDDQGWVQEWQTLDTPWELDPVLPPLQALVMEPDVDPFHAAPTCLRLHCQRASYRLPLEPVRPLLINLCAILQRHDPDLLLTHWGDTWLLPYLLKQARKLRLPLPLNRDAARRALHKEERTYFSYGQVIYRGQQIHLYGRWHIDGCNAVLFHDYGMEGVFELARVTALPVQTVARVSPGTGISAMQMVTALQQGILVPWHKQQAEYLKSALDLLHADQGGLVYQPVTGLHYNVAEVDFISMYPSIMARFNISPETVGTGRASAERVPELGLVIDRRQTGLVPQTLSPLLDKRLELKARLSELPAWDPRRKAYKARATAHKWLLVTCFGYLGYKNARFGRIEAHEAVTAYGREALLRAKEAAEDLGFEVLHMYVDGLWVKKEESKQPIHFQQLLHEITERTGLPIALEGIYRWVAFLPSRVDAHVPVPNRFFGLFQDGSFKLRGIEARRRDTPLFIVETQLQMLDILAKTEHLPDCLPSILALLRRRLGELRQGKIPVEQLLVSQKLSRNLEEYLSPSPVARAVSQLQGYGKSIRRGQNVRFLYTSGEPKIHHLSALDADVRAWDLPPTGGSMYVDKGRYTTLLLRAASTILQPLGVDEQTLRDWVIGNAGYLATPGYLAEQPGFELPLWAVSPSLIPG